MVLERGTAGTGAVLSLDAIGKQDTFLLGKDKKFTPPPIKQHTNFATNYRSHIIKNPIDNSLSWPFEKEVRFKITRPSPYGERYKLFVIKKNTFESEFSLKEYGIDLIKEENNIVVDTLQWNGEAKKSGFETGDYINELKIENLDRPNKRIIYPIAILLLIVFGYLNSRKRK